jgi:ATP-dependent Lon protease
MRIPFGKTVPLPIGFKDGQQKCTEFMLESRKTMNRHIYGMESAKLQIMQIIAQWIVNPGSVGNVIALQGPMGVGKTSFARNAIAEVLQRPFEFFTLGGASDIANFIGHSYTYEGSLWGRIVDSLMHANTMNPVMYFDELDKISGTPQGEEIVSMMIHMTDRSQNTQFHDRYFAGVDFDLSQCLFVFSFNDIEKVHPILRDRMTVIHCGGYNEKDKTVILKDYIWPQILDRLCFDKEEVILSDGAIKFMIEEYSKDEKGVRTLIRTVESMMTRLNMLRVAKHESMKDYKFYMDFVFPITITEAVVKTLLIDFEKKEPEAWKTLYC